MNYVQNY